MDNGSVEARSEDSRRRLVFSHHPDERDWTDKLEQEFLELSDDERSVVGEMLYDLNEDSLPSKDQYGIAASDTPPELVIVVDKDGVWRQEADGYKQSGSTFWSTKQNIRAFTLPDQKRKEFFFRLNAMEKMRKAHGIPKDSDRRNPQDPSRFEVKVNDSSTGVEVITKVGNLDERFKALDGLLFTLRPWEYTWANKQSDAFFLLPMTIQDLVLSKLEDITPESANLGDLELQSKVTRITKRPIGVIPAELREGIRVPTDEAMLSIADDIQINLCRGMSQYVDASFRLRVSETGAAIFQALRSQLSLAPETERFLQLEITRLGGVIQERQKDRAKALSDMMIGCAHVARVLMLIVTTMGKPGETLQRLIDARTVLNEEEREELLLDLAKIGELREESEMRAIIDKTIDAWKSAR
jgi:hypothetical protein